ncbi:hypothetical protein MKW92_045433 [Papaver armeniacum]|nr:hypothetical protein MKW92_045433 [Papaver armeniacum]
MVVVSNGGTLPPLIAAQLNYLITHSPFSVKYLNHRKPYIVFHFCKFSYFFLGLELNTSTGSDILQVEIVIVELCLQPFSFNLLTTFSFYAFFMVLNPIQKESPEEVRFTVHLLDMDINKLVHGCPWKHQQIIYLQVVFPIRRRYAPAPYAPRMKLVSSSELKALFCVKVCVAEYLPNLEETLKLRIVDAVASVSARRRFIEALAPICGGSPIEQIQKSTLLAATGVFINWLNELILQLSCE